MQRSALVFWPTQAKPITLSASTVSSSSHQNFLIGWNVRDFTIVVAAIVSASSLNEVYEAVKSMHIDVQRLCFSEHERASAPTLTIVGVLYNNNNNNNNNSSFSSSRHNNNNDDDDEEEEHQHQQKESILKALRSSTTAFVELEETSSSSTYTYNSDENDSNYTASSSSPLPRLRSLYTSSIKFDATLHLMCYQDKLFDIRKAPLPFSPLVRLGVGDVESILAGKNASRVLKGAQSVLEGPFLPPHALNLMPPLHPRHFAPRSLNTGSFTGTNVNAASAAAAAAVLAANNTNNNSGSIASSSPSQSFGTQNNNSSNTDAANIFEIEDQQEDDDNVEVDVSTLDPTIPPRLRFPTATSLTDLSCCKSCLSGASFVQFKLENWKNNQTSISSNESSLLSDDENNNTKNTNNNNSIKNSSPTILVSLAATATPIVAFLLQIAITLANFSYTGAILEYKLRELSNVLALIQKKTTTCGLHPVLPHTLCGLKGERRTCLLAFAARQIVGDILFGFILTYVLAFESDKIFDFMRQFAWYGLHGMHVGYFDWFHGYPAGFKMNADLNEVLYMISSNTMYFFSTIVDIVSHNIDIYGVSYLLLGASCFGGASFAFSFVADCCNLATLHIRFLYHAIAYFYQSLTTVTSSLLLLIRGKKNNPLKNRVDEASFEFDEVVLGTMGCCAAAFLIPTVAMYYLYLACARTVIWVIQESFRGIAVLCCNAPIFPGFLWLTRRKQWLLTGGVVLANIRSRSHFSNNRKASDNGKMKNTSTSKNDETNNNLAKKTATTTDTPSSDVVAEVVFLSLPFMTIFRELFLLIKLLFSGTFSVSRILRFIWFADSTSKPVVDVPNKIFKHLTADPAHPILVRGGGNSGGKVSHSPK